MAAGAPFADDGQDDRHGDGGDTTRQAHGQQRRTARQPLMEQPRTDDNEVCGADDQGNGHDDGCRAALERNLEQAHPDGRHPEHRVQVRRGDSGGEERGP
jgi:hypothetical protein